MITVVYLPNPFKPSSRILKPFTPDEVKTLADLKEHFKIHNPADFIWAINGRQIDTDKLDTAQLRACDFVAIAPKIRGGGGGGGKNVLGIVAGLALMAFTGGAGSGLLGGFLGSQGGMLGLGLALYLGGSLLMGNQKTPTIDTPKYDGAFEGGYGWSVDTIRNQPGNALPITFGSVQTSGQILQRRLVGGMHAGKWTQFLELLLAAGEGPLDSISDIKVNDIAIGSISGATYDTKLGTNNQTAVGLGLSQIAEQLTFSSELSLDTSIWVTKSMSEPGVRVTLEFVSPAGTYAVNTATGGNISAQLWIRGQYREVGAGTWVDMWPYYSNGERPLGAFNSRRPVYFKEDFTPPDPSKLYEFRMQNYTLKWYNDNEWNGAYTESPSNYSIALNWQTVTVWTNRTLTFPGTALVALSIPATENLSGSLPKVKWTQTRANIYAWNPTAAAYQQKPATNVAWMVYDLIHSCRLQYNIQTSSNQYVVYGEPAANLDYDAFNSWATFCATEAGGVARCVGNLLLDSAEQLWPAIQKIATSGRAFIIQQAGIFKPVWDDVKTVSQIFTAGNIINGTLKGGFMAEKDRATAIEASFLNEDNSFERDTLFVASEDYSPLSLDNPTQIYFPALTDSDIVYRACKHILRKNKYLRRTISFQADIDSIVAEIGDVIGVQSDITSWGVGGRVMGATTTKVIIDQAVTLAPGTTYTLLIRGADDTLTRKTVDAVLVSTTTTELNFTGDPWSSAPTRFSLYSFGVSELETKPFTVTGISRNGDLQATIEGVEYVAGVYSDDTDFPVIDYTAANAAISTLTVNADADTGKLAISWSIPEDRDYTAAIVFLDGKPYGFYTSEQNSTDIDAPPGTYTVTVIPIGGNGKGGDPVEEIVTLGDPTLSAVSNISLSSIVKQQADGTNLIFITGDFTIPTLATSVLVEIGEGSSPTSWKTVQDSRVDVVQYGPVEPGTLYTLRFTARNRYATATAVEEDVTTTGDTAAPEAPTVAASGYLKVIKVDIELVDPPSDLAGFEIWKNTTDNSGTATLAGYTAAVKGVASFVDQSPSYLSEMYYWAKSVDKWGNKSAFSASILPTHVSQILTGDITANQIIAKDFRTACNVGATQNGVMFNCAGLQAWCDGTKTVDIPTSGSPTFAGTITAAAGEIGGWEITSAGMFREFSCCNAVGLGRWKGYSDYFINGVYVSNCSDGCYSIVTIGRCLYQGANWCANDGLAVSINNCEWLSIGKPIGGGTPFAKIAGWNFNASCLWASNLLLNSAGSIQTCDFVTGNNGWKIDCLGNAEFNNVCARGAIRTAVFIKDEISVVGGCTMIRPAGVSAYDCCPAADTFSIYVNDSVDQFAINDLIRLKDDTNDFWGRVCACGCNSGGCYVTFVKCSGARFNLTKGQAIVNYGSCAGCGGIMLNGQCPYIDIYTHSGTPWNGLNSRVRLGNLDGWGAFSGATYGIAIGCPIGDNLTYDTASSLLKIRGDIEVISSGNLLADPDFREICYTTDYYMYGAASGCNIGEWCTESVCSGCILGIHKSNGARTTYRHTCSGAFLLSSCGTNSYSGVKSKNLIPVQPCATYTLSMYLSSHSGYVCPNAYAGMSFYTADGTQICSDYFLLNCCSAIPAACPTRFSACKTMPTTAAYAKVVVYNAYSSALSYLYVSGVQLELGACASMWKQNQGGTISADLVRSGTLVSVNYSAGTIGSCINMDNGTFALAGGAMCYNGSTLSLTACCGSVGGWRVGCNYLDKSSTGVGSIYLCPEQYTVLVGVCAANLLGYTSLGHMYWCNSWQNAVGVSVPWTTTGLAFAAGVAHCGTVTLPDSTVVACTCPFMWLGDTTNYMKYYNGALSVKGAICADSGCIATWNIGANSIWRAIPNISATAFMSFGGWCSSTADYPGIFFSADYSSGCTYVGMGLKVFTGSWSCKVGIVARVAAKNLFQIHACGDGSNLVANIAGWNFNAACLYAGALVMNSAGSITGNYTAGSAGWCISCTGAAEFNSVTIRGTVCATAGRVGNICISASCLWPGVGAMTIVSDYFCSTGCMNVGYTGINTCRIVLGIGNIQAYNCNGSGSLICNTLRYSAGSTDYAMCICMFGGSTCYAFCTNGRILVGGTTYPSDRNLKTDFQAISVLSALRQMPVTKWRFCDSQDYQIGPVAQDFNRAFRLNHDWQTNLTVGGLDGIALRGVQELDECVAYNNRRILDLESRNACLETQINCITKELLQLKAA